jgi:colanic acid/amylovoran biosynthesis glycosyltransferase
MVTLPAGLVGKRLLVLGVNWPNETFIVRKVQGLARLGMQVTVAATNPWKSAGPDGENVDVVWLPQSLRSGWRDLRRLGHEVPGLLGLDGPTRAASKQASAASMMRPALRLRRFARLAPLRPDLVHFEWNTSAIDYLPLIDLWGCPFVVSCRGAQVNVRPHIPGNEGYLAALREVFRRAAAVHCVSAAIRDEATQLGLDPARATIITPAVPHDDFVPAAPRPAGAPLRLISIGLLEWRKGLELALVAFRRLIDAGVDAHYTLIGDGAERLRVLYTIQDLGLSDRVEWLGKQPSAVVREQLRKSDVLLLTSFSEGIANVVLEAMACGLPVVTSDGGGMREAVRDGVDGRVVPVRDVDATAQALVELARDPARRQRMGASARERIVAEFTLDQQLERFVGLYASVLEGRPMRSHG